MRFRDSFVQGKPGVRVERLGATDWDLAPDGRTVVLTPVESPQAAPDHTAVFLQHFLDEPKRRVRALAAD